MKKTMILVSAAVMLAMGLMFVGCNKDEVSSKPSTQQVMNLLPGTWQITFAVDEDGTQVPYEEETIWTFYAKGEKTPPKGSGISSNECGVFSLVDNEKTIISNGRWNIEGEDALLYFHNNYGQQYSFDGEHFYYIVTSISSSSMRWDDENSQAGYIFTRK